MQRIIGIKKEMTQVFSDDGTVVPVTVVDISGNIAIEKKTKDSIGYDALLIGKGKKKNASKPEQGVFAKLKYVPLYLIESRDDDYQGELGKELELEDITGKKVDVTGITKGKGFQGVVKRWGFAGGPKTHGQSDRWRAPGSIGSGTTPGRVYKGKKMPGRMGGERHTVKNLLIQKHLLEDGLVLVKGAVPGPKNSQIIITVK